MDNLLDCTVVAWLWKNALLLLIVLGVCLLLYRQWRIRYLDTHYKNYKLIYVPPEQEASVNRSFESFTGPTLIKRRWTGKHTNFYFEDKIKGKPVELFFSSYYGQGWVTLDFEYSDPREVVKNYWGDHKEMMRHFTRDIRYMHYEKMNSGKDWTPKQAAVDIKNLLEENYGKVLVNGTVHVLYMHLQKANEKEE